MAHEQFKWDSYSIFSIKKLHVIHVFEMFEFLALVYPIVLWLAHIYTRVSTSWSKNNLPYLHNSLNFWRRVFLHNIAVLLLFMRNTISTWKRSVSSFLLTQHQLWRLIRSSVEFGLCYIQTAVLRCAHNSKWPKWFFPVRCGSQCLGKVTSALP